MGDDIYLEDISIYTYEVMQLLRKLIFSLAPFYKIEAKVSELNQHVTVPLFTSLYSTSESILILVHEKGIWEADILLRTLIEGTIKYIFLMAGDAKENEEIIKEYYYTIPEIKKISQHKKAKQALELLKLYSDEKHPFEVSILTEEELKLLEEKYPQKLRKEIEQKWGFGSLLKSLIDRDKKYKNLVGLYYTYAFSSHLIHFDGDCVKMRQDTLMKYVYEKDDALDLAHAIRIISNILSLGIIRTSEYISHYGIEIKNLADNIKDIEGFLYELENKNRDLIRGNF